MQFFCTPFINFLILEKNLSMPKNKNQIQRYQTINHLLNLRKGSVVHISELIDRCNASERTVKGDIQFLRDHYDAPIKHEIQRNGYFYSESFDLPLDLSLSHGDISRLKIAVETLNQLQNLDIFKDLQGIIQKIEQSVRFRLDKAPSKERILYFEPVPFYRGTEHMPVFLKAIESTQRITFEYKSFKSPVKNKHTIEPFFLQEHSHRWYVVGRLLPYDSVTSFALERIIGEPEILKEYFDMPVNFTAEQYFKHTFGMTNNYNDPIEEIHLQFDPLQAKYFVSKPFHHYEKVEETNNHLIVKMHLKINFELIRKLAGMGNAVKVLKPQSLVIEMKQFFEKSFSQYTF